MVLAYIMDFLPDTIILGGGDYPSHPVPLQLLRGGARVICCDGAVEGYLKNEGRAPWRIVGDGDSLPADIERQYADIIRRIPEQETNDQTKATRYALEHGARSIAYLGATGRREDHTLGNISLLLDYMRMGLEIRMYTDHGVFIPCHGQFQAECQPETQVSIISFGAKDLKADGLRYPLSDFTSWWQGTLNAATGTSFKITGQGDYLVFLTYEPKILTH